MAAFTPDSTPLLVFGGPYSNLEATQALQAEAVRLGIPASNILCTGDLVAYCASPQATLDLIRRWGIAVVMGNCEESLANDADDCGCGFTQGSTCDLLSLGWFRFAKPRIRAADKAWMQQLPRQLTFRFAGLRCLAIHGGVQQINQFIFASTESTLKAAQLQQAGVDLIIGGHCGLPFGELIGSQAWLNAGVIGMPANDGTAQTWYMLLTPTPQGVVASWHRLGYAVEHTVEKMTRAGLTQGYHTALLNGRWPSTDILPDQERAMSGQRLSLTPLLLPPAGSARAAANPDS